MSARTTMTYPVTNIQLTEAHFRWLTSKSHKDRITPSQRVALFIQQAIEKEADLAKYGTLDEHIPEIMAETTSVTVTLESHVLRKVKALAERRGMSVSRVINLAANLLVSTRK